MAYIYKITNRINNKCYIGATLDWERRFYQHRYNYKQVKAKPSLINTNRRFHQAITIAFYRYGIDNFDFEVLEECSKNDMKQREQFYVKKFNSWHNGYNSTAGGDTPYNPILENDIKNIIFLYQQNLNIEQISQKLHKAKRIVVRVLEDEGLRTKGESEFLSQKEHIIALYQKGCTYRDIAKMVGCSNSTARNYCKKERIVSRNTSKPVVQIDKATHQIVNIYKSQIDAAKALNLESYKSIANHISECCLGKRKSTQGYYWQYYNKN